MLITGNETNNELNSKCSCGSIIEKGIKMDQECLTAELVHNCGGGDGNKTMCLKELLIPIESSFCLDKIISPKSVFTMNNDLCDYKFIAFYAKDNKQLYYRFIDPYDDNLETVNYNFDIDIVTTSLVEDNVGIIVDITLIPDNTNYVATWDNIDTISINGMPFQNWNQADLSWFEIGTTNIANRLTFPDISGQLTDTLIRDENGNIPTSVIKGNIISDDGKLNFHFEVEMAYDFDTTTLTYSLKKAELQLNEFLDPDIFIETTDILAANSSGTFLIVGSGFSTVGFQTGDSFDINGEVFILDSEFAVGATDADTAQNFIDAINTDTNINTLIIATHDYTVNTNGGGIITITAITAGDAGNNIVISVGSGNNTTSDTTLGGGTDAIPFATDNIDGDNIATITIDGKLKTIDAKRYRSMDTFLILSSIKEMKLEDIEFYNDNTKDVELKILAAL